MSLHNAALLLTLTATLVSAAAIGHAPPAQAETTLWGQDRGAYFGAALLSNALDVEEASANADPDQLFIDRAGGGLALFGGYAFTPAFDTRFVLTGAGHKTNFAEVDAQLGSATIEARYRFLARARARPYLMGGVGGGGLRVVREGVDLRLGGGMATMAAGFELNLTRHLVFDLGARLDLINWNDVELSAPLPNGTTFELQDDVEGSSRAFKMLFGLSWQL